MTNSTSTDTLDLRDIAQWLRRGWKLIVSGVAAGAAVALLVVLFAPRKFEGAASAIIRATPDAGSGMLSRLGDAAGAASLLGVGASAPIETDIQILSSRAVAGAVVDSLVLQVEVRSPSVPATSIVRAAHLPGSFKRLDVAFERRGTGAFHFESGKVSGDVAAGGSVALPVGTVTLQGTLPDHFTLRLVDRSDAVLAVTKNLTVAKAGGEVLRVAYRTRDSVTAADVPNTVLVNYLARRKTDDRGANAHRAEFLMQQIDSTSALQVVAEDRLRRFQEQSGLIDPLVVGKLELESAAELQRNLGALQIEGQALDELLAQVAAGHMTARQLVAFPSFLKSPGINDLLRQLAELETERSRLLERRLETDDQVQALTKSIVNIEGQLVPLASAYSRSLRKQRSDLSGQIATMTQKLSGFPGSAQASARATREVMRLAQLSLALQAQLVQARLAAISEGGDVRALDRAVPPKKPVFPDPWITAGLGMGVGLLVGLIAAIVSGTHGQFVEGAGAIERVFGVPVVRAVPGFPLLMTGRETARSVLVVPVDGRVSTQGVATRLADTALARGGTATVIDLSEPGQTTLAGAGAASVVARAEESASFVVVRLGGLASNATVALLSNSRPVLLVASAGRVKRRSLTDALDLLRRLDVPCAGVVLTEAHDAAPAAS